MADATKQTWNKYRLETESSGAIKLFTPYNAGFIAELKDAIPSTDRMWEPTERYWWVSADHADVAMQIVGQYFIDETFIKTPPGAKSYYGFNASYSASDPPPSGGPKVYGDPGFEGWAKRAEEAAKKNGTYGWSGFGTPPGPDWFKDMGGKTSGPETDEQRRAREARERDKERADRARQQRAKKRGGMSQSDALRTLYLSEAITTIPIEVIEAVWKALVKLHHPDRGGDVERMKSINQARDVLMKGRK